MPEFVPDFINCINCRCIQVLSIKLEAAKQAYMHMTATLPFVKDVVIARWR